MVNVDRAGHSCVVAVYNGERGLCRAQLRCFEATPHFLVGLVSGTATESLEYLRLSSRGIPYFAGDEFRISPKYSSRLRNF